MAKEKPKPLTLQQALRAKYPADRYALFFEVPDAVSLDARRRIDAVAVGIWKSVGRSITGFEFKASRSDWLRELKQVDKADPFVSLCDYFFLVTTEREIANLAEIPASWGWMTATPHGMRIERPATKLPTDKAALPWAFTVGILRKLQDNLMASPDVRVLIEQQRKDFELQVQQRVEQAVKNVREGKELERLQKRLAEFQEEAGIKIDDWNIGDVGAVVKHLLELDFRDRKHGSNFIANRLFEQAKAADEIATKARELAAKFIASPETS